MKVYMIVDKTDSFYRMKFRSVHTTLEGAQTRMKEYTEYYEDYCKALVEIIQIEVEE